MRGKVGSVGMSPSRMLKLGALSPRDEARPLPELGSSRWSDAAALQWAGKSDGARRVDRTEIRSSFRLAVVVDSRRRRLRSSYVRREP